MSSLLKHKTSARLLVPRDEGMGQLKAHAPVGTGQPKAQEKSPRSVNSGLMAVS